MFTYQLSEPRRPFASALQATLIHATLIAGAVVATKTGPAILHHSAVEIPLMWSPAAAHHVAPACRCGVAVPGGVTTIPAIPDIPRVPPVGIPSHVDARTLVDGESLTAPAGLTGDSLSATTILAEAAVDDPPTLIAAGSLRYPAVLDAAHVEGSVTLGFVIDAEGRVESEGLSVVSATDPGFVPAAREAVLTSRFHPAMKAHHPVRVLVHQVITFKH